MSAIETLAAALHAACLRDLPDIEYDEIDHVAERRHLDSLTAEQKNIYYKAKQSAVGGDEFFTARGIRVVRKTKRPWTDACDVTMFQQSWPNTSCGYDAQSGIAGQAFTNAYTVIVRCEHTGCAAVYFGGGRLAYLVPVEKQDESWRAAVSAQHLPSQRGAKDLGWNSLLTRCKSACLGP